MISCKTCGGVTSLPPASCKICGGLGMINVIDKFEGQYRFLSNFWPCEVELDGLPYKSTEAAYQAAKTLDEAEREEIRHAKTAAATKKLGRKICLRPDWERVKLGIMRDLIRQKFTKHEVLKQRLIDTNPAELIEGNYWNDKFWGVCNGEGDNHLGRILMEVRAELLND